MFSLARHVLPFLIAISLFFNTTPLFAQDLTNITNQPASEGRKITPAGKLISDATTNQIAIGSLPIDFVRSPDKRYLLAINSGFGIQSSAKEDKTSRQSISVIDLNAAQPTVIQNVYFPSPMSVNVGAVFVQKADADGTYRLFISGGYQNKIWLFKFSPANPKPISPVSETDSLTDRALFIDVAAFATNAPSPNYNDNIAAVYPSGIAVSDDGETLYSANNLGDTLGIITDLRDTRKISRVDLRRPNSTQFVYPYQVKVTATKAFVSLWGDGTIAVVNTKNGNKVSHIKVERHPTAMILNKDRTKLFVVNSNADSVSVIDTNLEKVFETFSLKLTDKEPIGASPEGLALSDDEQTLYVANAHANAVAVVSLNKTDDEKMRRSDKATKPSRSLAVTSSHRLLGFIPTGQYPSAVAVVNNQLYIGNGKGTGVENSSLIVNNSGYAPNAPNLAFPSKPEKLGGQYSVSVVVGNISNVTIPNERKLFEYTQAVMRNNELLGEKKSKLFQGVNPIKHIIYIIRENRTYDQVFGNVETSGDGTKADGEKSLAIFSNGEMSKSPRGESQSITPNAQALAQRFGLFDRFFVNAEASPDGHNWSTAAFSNDYVDKAYRWDYSGRGRTYDYEGFNRLPSYEPPGSLPPVFNLPTTEDIVASYMQKFVPYTQGNRDVAEPETLYLWDAAQRKGLSYRNYGEYLGTISENDLKEINTRKAKSYPDISKTLKVVPTKKTLEGHFNPTYRNFDMKHPDIMTTYSYKDVADKSICSKPDVSMHSPCDSSHGISRFSEWNDEFDRYVADLDNGKGDKMPNLSILHLSSDHTSGLSKTNPTPQFYVADNDYAIGRIVEEVSNSPYWKDTAIFIVEDDAQDGPDHVDAHRSPAFVISAYNRKGALIHSFHNTVSLIRTMEILLGLPPMNLLDATASPIDIFQDTPDLTPYKAEMPQVALDNLLPPTKTTAEMRKYMKLTEEQDLKHPDMANAKILNEIIWFSVTGNDAKMPAIARLPAFNLMTTGLREEESADAEE
jgi:YVTN family beta-propeller protein